MRGRIVGYVRRGDVLVVVTWVGIDALVVTPNGRLGWACMP